MSTDQLTDVISGIALFLLVVGFFAGLQFIINLYREHGH